MSTKKTLQEIAKLVNGNVVGDGQCEITGVAGIEEAQAGDVTFVINQKYLSMASSTKASAVVAGRDVAIEGVNVVQVDNPSLALAEIIGVFQKDIERSPQGVHDTAIISDKADIGADVAIGPYAVIEEGVSIGKGTIIESGVVVCKDATIGENCWLYPHVVVRERVEIGSRVIIHSGSVVGADGFGYEPQEGKHIKIPQIGTVLIEDDVEIGANVTIDRARMNKTIIGAGTKIDNLVQIAHNVVIGKNCIIISQVGISGSTKLGDNVILAGQVGLAGHLEIGDNSIVGAKSGVSKSIPANKTFFGTPAQDIDKEKETIAIIKRLPSYIRAIKELKERVKELESQK